MAQTAQMTQAQAYQIVGDQPEWAVRNMKRALSMMRMLNTQEEEERLQAATVWLRMGAKKRQEFFEARRT